MSDLSTRRRGPRGRYVFVVALLTSLVAADLLTRPLMRWIAPASGIAAVDLMLDGKWDQARIRPHP